MIGRDTCLVLLLCRISSELWLIRMSLLQKSWKMFFVIPTKVEIQSFQAVARNLDSRLGGNDGMSRFFTNEPEPFN